MNADSCQWGEWEDHTQECNSTLCGPQKYTRTRKSINSPEQCETNANLENWKTVEECPLNECLGNVMHVSIYKADTCPINYISLM